MAEQGSAGRGVERGDDVPGPRGFDWLVNVPKLVREDTAPLLARMREEYGPVVRLYRPNRGKEAFLLSDPADVQRVLETDQGNYHKSAVYLEELSEVFGRGLLTSRGDLWARQNRVIAPMFTRESVHSFDGVVTERTAAMLDRWAERAARDEPIHLLEEMERVTLLIIGEAMFSADMAEHAETIGGSLSALRRQFQRETSSLWTPPGWLPTPLNRRAAAAREQLDDLVYDLIEKRRGDAEAYDDLLSKLMLARDEETGRRMDDEQVRDEITTFLLAGHETTAAALTWTWYLLARNPEIHQRLHEQIAAGGAPAEAGFSPDAMADLRYVRQCVQEAMRVYPPVPVFSREVCETTVLGGYEIPASSEVLLSQFAVQRDPEVWADPLVYRPERFDPGWEETTHRYAYFPFGGGARMCIGRQFALMEAQLILAQAAERFRLEVVSPTDGRVGVDSAVTMVPDEELIVLIEPWD